MTVRKINLEISQLRDGAKMYKYSHNQTINGYHFTENNANKIFGGDSRSLDTSTDYRRSSNENTPALELVESAACVVTSEMTPNLPCSSNHTQAN